MFSLMYLDLQWDWQSHYESAKNQLKTLSKLRYYTDILHLSISLRKLEKVMVYEASAVPCKAHYHL